MTSRRFVRPACALGILLSPLSANAATYYVAPAPAGSDTNAGTQASPFATFAKGQTVAAAGDTVYFRAGTYAYTAGLTTCASTTDTINAILLSKSGTSGSPIQYWAYPGETPTFDFSGIKDSCRVTGFRVTGSWIYLKGLEVEGVPQNNMDNHESWGIWNSGSNNTYELINTHNNMGPGLFIQEGGNNLVLNCDSHDNYDTMSSNGAGNNADGFGCHIGAGGTGNVFRGCRSWWNSDDGFDFIQAQEVVTVENTWSWYNGYIPETMNACANCNGNGFKGGGYNIPPTDVPANPPSHILQNCLAFMNTAAGFYANHEPVGDHFYNDTSYDNGADFNLLGIDYISAMDGGYPAQNVGYLRNNIAFMGTLLENATGPMVNDENNSWDPSLGVTVTAADFQSTSIAGMDGPRQADGSLPCVPFMRLAAGSDLIGKGVNVGLPFTGANPDLGAFPYGPCTEADAGTDAAPGDGGAAGAGGDAAPGSDGSAGTGSSDGGGGTTPPGGEAGTGSEATEGGTGGQSANGAGSSSGCGCTTVSDSSSRSCTVALLGLVGLVGTAKRRRFRGRRHENGKS
jgi:MYXO-CTERM domain-containing protein